LFADEVADDPLSPATNDVSHSFTKLHVMSKNLQSIRDHERFQHCVSELNDASFDAFFVTETWRGERQEFFFTTTHGHVLFLSGGEGFPGVGIVLSVGFFRELLQVSFHPGSYSLRICALHFQSGGIKNQNFLLFSDNLGYRRCSGRNL
jgi:hypothetical protein